MERIRIAIDAMGGDLAPAAPVEAAAEAIRQNDGIELILLGDEQAIRSELDRIGFSDSRLSVVHCT